MFDVIDKIHQKIKKSNQLWYHTCNKVSTSKQQSNDSHAISVLYLLIFSRNHHNRYEYINCFNLRPFFSKRKITAKLIQKETNNSYSIKCCLEHPYF